MKDLLEFRGCRTFLQLQVYFYCIDSVNATLTILLFLFKKIPMNILTIQLTTIAVIPTMMSISNSILYNSLLKKIESNFQIKLDGRITLAGLEVDERALILIGSQVILYVMKMVLE